MRESTPASITARLVRVGTCVLLTITILASPLTGHEHDTAEEHGFSPALITQLQKLKDAALADDYAYRQVAYLSQKIGPRLSGSEAANDAVHYVASQMRQLGLRVELEPVEVPHWVRGNASATLVGFPGGDPATEQRIAIAALRGSSSTGAEPLTADIVVVETFDQLDALPASAVDGRIVVFNERFDVASGVAPYAAYRKAVRYRELGPKAAAAKGAVAVLVRSVGTGTNRLPHTGDSEPAGIPAAAVALEDADLLAKLCHEGRVRMRLVLTPKELRKERSFNVIADLKGAVHPEQIVVVSAHLDSWDLGRGALDDGVGIATAMATLHLLRELHLRPARTLRFIAWMDEEQDGSGSARYAEEHKTEFDNTVLAMESDVGASQPIGFQGHLSPAAMATLRPVRPLLASLGASDLISVSRPPGTTDLDLLARAGVPTLGILDDGTRYFDYHHTADDTLDKVQPAELQKNVAAFATMAYAVASMKPTLPRTSRRPTPEK